MTIIKCPKCKCDVEINIANSWDEEGETFRCSKCKFVFRYAPEWYKSQYKMT